MDKILAPFLGSYVRAFMNDFAIYSSQLNHAQKVDEVVKKIDQAGGQLNPGKCKLFKTKVILLGHEVSQNGISPDPTKVEALALMNSPKSMKQLMSFVQKL